MNNEGGLVGLILPSALSEYKGPRPSSLKQSTPPQLPAPSVDPAGESGEQQDSTNAGEICEIGLWTGQVEWRCHPVTKIPILRVLIASRMAMTSGFKALL